MRFDEFTSDNVVLVAQQVTGLSTFRHDRFRAGLEQMITSMRTDAQMSADGVTQQFERFVGLVANRLRADRLFIQQPEILEEPLGPLTVIVGLPRTGTTKLQRALSRHPDLNFTTGWEVLMPVPLSGDKATPDDERRTIVARSLQEQNQAQQA